MDVYDPVAGNIKREAPFPQAICCFLSASFLTEEKGCAKFPQNFRATSFQRGRVMNRLSHLDKKGQREMPQRFHGVRRALLIPLGLDAVLLFVLLMIALLLKGDRAEKLVFTLFFLPSLALFLWCLRRRVTVAEAGLAIRKLWSDRTLSWDEITRVGCLTLHKKVYLLLTTVKGFFIVSSVFEGFPTLAEEIVARVGPEKVEEDCRLQVGRPAMGIAGIVSAWIAAAAMIGILLLKLLPYCV
jgi:hypothetical protein